MSETLGAFVVDAAEGVLLPAKGVEVFPNPMPPPDSFIDASRAGPVGSPIRTVRAFATPAAALAEAAAYGAAVGAVLVFRGVYCFVADVILDHQAAGMSGAGEARLVADWVLVAQLNWAPEESP